MTRYEVTVTYTVDVQDQAELVAAGSRAWEGLGEGAWTVAFDEEGAQEIDARDSPTVELMPEASLSLLVGQQGYPTVPGVQFAGMGVDAKPLK